MFKKLFISFCLIALFLPTSLVFAKGPTPLPTPTPTPTEEYDFTKMTTYEMFWPIVAGKIPGDRFYSLKLWRDKMVGFLFFSKIKKSEYLKQQANKRLVEAEKLLEIQRFSYFPQTLEISTDNLNKGLEILMSAPDSQSKFWLSQEYAKDLQKHLVVLGRMNEEAGKEEKVIIEKSIEKIKDLIAKYSL